VISMYKCEYMMNANISCSLYTMKRSRTDSFVPVNPNAPKKRRNKSLATYGQVLSFSDALDSESPRSMPSHDENRPLSSPWMPTPRFRIWGHDWGPSASTLDSAFSSVHSESAQTSGLRSGPHSGSSGTSTSNVGDTSTNSTARDHFAAYMHLPVPLESPPVLLELRRMAGDTTLGTSGMREYKSSGTPPAAKSAWKECKENVLKALSDAGRSPLDLVLDILDSTQLEYENYRSRWFSPNNNKLSLLLDQIFAHPKGKDLISCWMKPRILDSVCSMVGSEMDSVVGKLSLPSVEHISPQFINDWTLETIIEPATLLCPSLLRILEAVASKVPDAPEVDLMARRVHSSHIIEFLATDEDIFA
jgi:hypothetical protein